MPTSSPRDVKDLHTYGKVFTTHWVTIHDTDTDGTTPYDANAPREDGARDALQAARERAVPARLRTSASSFSTRRETPTSNTQAGIAYGGFGSVMKLTYAPGSNDGTLALFYLRQLPAFRVRFNVAFADDHRVVFVEDAGDTLHTQRGASRFRVRPEHGSRLLDRVSSRSGCSRSDAIRRPRSTRRCQPAVRRFPERWRQRDHGLPYLRR